MYLSQGSVLSYKYSNEQQQPLKIKPLNANALKFPACISQLNRLLQSNHIYKTLHCGRYQETVKTTAMAREL